MDGKLYFAFRLWYGESPISTTILKKLGLSRRMSKSWLMIIKLKPPPCFSKENVDEVIGQ